MTNRIQATCPYCGGAMTEGFIALSGGLWFSESRENMEAFVKGHVTGGTSEFRNTPIAQRGSFHTIVSGRGFRSGEWPREGLLCESCSVVILKYHTPAAAAPQA